MSVNHHAFQQPRPDQLTQATLIELRTTTERLATDIDQLTDDWDAVDEVDTNLGVDVEGTGVAVIALLDNLTRLVGTMDPVLTQQLQQYAGELGEAVTFYADLDQHETNASIDIVDQLMPGVALALRILNVLSDPANPEE